MNILEQIIDKIIKGCQDKPPKIVERERVFTILNLEF
jgi:hypothetical protein